MLNQRYLTSICYVIVTGDSYDSSFFNGYDNSLVRNTDVFKKIGTLPKSMDELFFVKEDMISARLSGVLDGYKVRFCPSLESALELPYDFKVALVDAEDCGRINRAFFISGAQKDIESYKSVRFEDLNFSSARENLLKLSRDLSPDKSDYISKLEYFLSRKSTGKYIYTDFKFDASLYNSATLAVLSSLRVKYGSGSLGLKWDEDKASEPLELLRDLRGRIFKNVPPAPFLPHVDLILTDMSSDLNSLVLKQHYTQSYLRNEGHADPRGLIEALTFINRNSIAEGLDNNSIVHQFYMERLLIEAMVGLYAAGYASPCIKIPLGNKSVFGTLKNIGIIDRGTSHNKLNSEVLNLVGELDKFMKVPLDQIQEGYTSAIKLISNLPIEWAHHNDLPLMVRHEVSRIPISPGMSTMMSLLDGEQIYLGLTDLKKVRVISSFEENDVLKYQLENKIELLMSSRAYDEKFLSEQANKLGAPHCTENIAPLDIDIEWYKVNSAEEFLLGLSNNDCAVTIFNMHGGHGLEGTGTFAVGSDEVSVYDLLGKFQASPIVILCSCDTNPIDRNHYSTAAAFQLAGAKTVLASALPILSDEASTFIARLLLRIKLYLPKRLANGDGLSIRWSSFVAGMVRRSFYTELFDSMAKEFGITAHVKSKLNYYAGTKVDPLHEHWHEEIMQYVSETIGVDADVIHDFMKSSFAFPECLKYIQMGNPESIIIAAERHIATAQ